MWAFGAGVERERLARRVSWTPGAEGAPRAEVVWVGALVEGTIRRDWGVLVRCLLRGALLVMRTMFADVWLALGLVVGWCGVLSLY